MKRKTREEIIPNQISIKKNISEKGKTYLTEMGL